MPITACELPKRSFHIAGGKTVVKSAHRTLGEFLARYAELTSADLVRACAGSKEEAAWAEFVRRFQVVIAATVLRTSRHWGEMSGSQVDDLIQDTFLKLCEDDCRLLRSFQPRHEDSIYGFLKVVAANVVHDHFKSALAAKRGGGQTETVLEPAQVDARTVGNDLFSALNQRLQLEHVDQILRRGTAGKDQERKVTIFWLRHRQGLTASEIAAIPSLGLTTEGVESVLLRLAEMIRSHVAASLPHRDVKALNRKSRSTR